MVALIGPYYTTMKNIVDRIVARKFHIFMNKDIDIDFNYLISSLPLDICRRLQTILLCILSTNIQIKWTFVEQKFDVLRELTLRQI